MAEIGRQAHLRERARQGCGSSPWHRARTIEDPTATSATISSIRSKAATLEVTRESGVVEGDARARQGLLPRQRATAMRARNIGAGRYHEILVELKRCGRVRPLWPMQLCRAARQSCGVRS